MIDKKKRKKKSEKTQKEDFQEMFQRLQAEFANYKKRTEQELVDAGAKSKASLIEKLIPVIDNFELALKHGCSDKNYEMGMKMIHGLLIDMLHSEHVNIIDPLGQKFDPNLHEAVGTKKEDKGENEILEVAQKGYLLKDIVIRRARVIVNQK